MATLQRSVNEEKGKLTQLYLSNVHYIPELLINLIPCFSLQSHQVKTVIAHGYCTLLYCKENNQLIGNVTKRADDGLYFAKLLRPGRNWLQMNRVRRFEIVPRKRSMPSAH